MKFPLFIASFLVSLHLSAATVYLAQTATGDGSGSGTGNRMALVTINSSWTLSAGFQIWPNVRTNVAAAIIP